jgi:hypothetical protein
MVLIQAFWQTSETNAVRTFRTGLIMSEFRDIEEEMGPF